MKNRLIRIVAALVVAGPTILAGLGIATDRCDAAEESGDATWLTGAALQKRLADDVDVVWTGNPFRVAVQRLSKAYRVAVLMDRRIDPNQRVDINVASVSLASAIQEIAERRQLAVAQLGPVVYLGPMEAALRLRTLAMLREEEVRQLGPAGSGKFLRRKSLEWPDLATPRDLLEQLAEESGVKIAGMEQVPHDLWAAASLPPLTWIDRVTLITNQFDLTFETSDGGRQIRLTPVPKTVALVRNYPGGSNPAAVARRYESLVPDAQVKVVGDRVYVRGRLEDHDRITSPLRSVTHADRKTQSPVPGAKVLIRSLTIQEQPVGPVLSQLAAKLKFELRMDRSAIEAAGISLDQRVSMQVENATLDDVLRELLKTTGLTYRHQNGVVEIVPR
jgi:hypothetical protein